MKHFFLAPMSSAPLFALRTSISILLLVQAFSLLPELENFFGANGILRPELNDFFIVDHIMPRISDFTTYLSLPVIGLIYVVSLICLLSGVWIRTSAAIACVLHATFLTTGYYAAYGVDRFTQICLFYFIFMPTGKIETTSRATLSLRVLQIHLAISYVAAGVEKIVGVQWREGEAILRAVSLPSFNQFDLTWMAHVPWLGLILCWGTLILEIGYGVFIWPRRTRAWWIVGIELLHAGIAITMGLYFFAMVMGALTFCLFWIPTVSRDTLVYSEA